MPKFGSVASVKALVPNGTFNKAKEVLRSDKLQDVVFEGEFLERGNAMCQGSNPGDIYSVSISIKEGSSGAPSGQCSCPAASRGGLCKHAIALLLKRVDELTSLKQTGGASSNVEAESIELETLSSTFEPSISSVIAVNKVVEEPQAPTVLNAERLAISTKVRVLPPWMLVSIKQKTDTGDEDSKAVKSTKRAAIPRKPRLPPAKRARGRRQLYEDEEEMEEEENVEINDVEDDGVAEDLSTATVKKSRASRGRRSREESDEDSNPVAEDDLGVQAEQDSGRRLARRSMQTVVPDRKPEEIKRTRRLRKMVQHEGTDTPEEPEAPSQTGRGEESSEGFDLTSDDLLLLAKKNLQNEELDNEAPEIKDDVGTRNKKKSASVFSARQWQSSASQGDGKAESMGSGPAGDERPEDRMKKVESKMKTSESFLDDMFGLLLPSLKSDEVPQTSSQKVGTKMDAVVAIPSPSEMDEPVQPKAKKKSSLKDRVKMFL